MKKVKKKISFDQQNVYVGIDVHKKSWTVAVCTEHRVYRPFVIRPTNVEVLVNYLQQNYPEGTYICAYETGFSGFGLCEALQELGIECLVVNPADVPTSNRDAAFKTDQRDATKIAKSLRSGEIYSIYIPSKSLQADRSIARLHDQFKRDFVRQKNRIKSLLFFYSVKIPEAYDNKGRWSRAFISWLYQVELPVANATDVLRHQMGQFTYVWGMKRNCETWLKQLSRKEPYLAQADLVESVPGMGRLTAIKFLLQLGPIERFHTLESLCSYVGLVPGSHSSGERIRQNRLTYRGHTQLRVILVEAAWTAIGVDPALNLCYEELKKRMVGQKAIIRIARKLLSRIRYVLTHQTAYEKGVIA